MKKTARRNKPYAILKQVNKNVTQNNSRKKHNKKPHMRASLVPKSLIQETRVQSLIQQDPTGHRETKPTHHNYCACTLELGNRNY